MPKSEFLPLLASVLGENFIGWNKVVELNPCSVPRNKITLEMCRQAYAKDPSVDQNEFEVRCFEEYMKMCFPDENTYVYMCEKYIRENDINILV